MRRPIVLASCRFSFVLVTGLLLFTQVSLAREFTPFRSSNKNPFVRIFGLPPVQDASAPDTGQIQLTLTQNVSNHFFSHSTGNETVYLDGETRETRLTMRIGLNQRTDLGIQIAELKNKGGSLDSFIESWHGFFGLPNGSRDNIKKNDLQFYFERDGLVRASIRESTTGMTDSLVYISLSNPFSPPVDNRYISLRAGVKLATGEMQKLTGSGESDYFIDIMLKQQALESGIPHSWYAGAGILRTGKSRWSEDFQKTTIYFGHAGMVWHATQRLDFKCQVDIHTPFYESNIKAMGENAVQLILGGSLLIGKGTILDIGVSEDLNPGTGPDVNFQLSLSRSFR